MAKRPKARPSPKRKPQSSPESPAPAANSWVDPFGPYAVAAILLLVVWLARYWGSSGFGLYVDDPPRVIPAMESSWADLWPYLWEILSGFHGQGRPLHPILIHLIPHWAARIAGLQSVYWAASLIVALNGFLLYSLLRKLSGSQFLALTAAVAFCVFPADTTQAYLTLAFGGQPSITFFLLAAHCWFTRWRPLSYVLVLGSLTCYETVFPLFLALPLLRPKWDGALLRLLALHGVFVGGSLAGMALIRRAIGETFVSGLSADVILTRPFEQMAVGPATSLAMFFYRPWKSLPAEFPSHWMLLAFTFAGFAALLWLMAKETRESAAGPPFRQLWRIAAAGLAMLVLAYPITFTASAGTIDGRDTRVHMAAAVGGAILIGALAALALKFLARPWSSAAAVGVLALLFTGAIAFGLNVQRDYRLAWAYQQRFWADVARLCPDMDRSTVILVNRRGFRTPRQMEPWGWDMPAFLQRMYEIPGPWTPMPTVYQLRWNWRELVGKTGSLMDGADPKGWRIPDIEDPSFIYLREEEGELVRAEGPLEVEGRRFPLRPVAAPGEPPYGKKLQGRLLLSPPAEEASYLRP